jgi:hypothetical protein
MAKVKPAAWSVKADGSLVVRVNVRAWPRTPSVGPETPAVGATLSTVIVVWAAGLKTNRPRG